MNNTGEMTEHRGDTVQMVLDELQRLLNLTGWCLFVRKEKTPENQIWIEIHVLELLTR